MGLWGLDLLCDGGEDGLGRGGLLGRGLGRRSVLIRWDQMDGWGAVIPLFLLGGIRISSLSLTRTECPLCPWYPWRLVSWCCCAVLCRKMKLFNGIPR